MARTRKQQVAREVSFKLVDKYTGWYGDGCWAQEGRKFLKRLQRRHNRHVLDRSWQQEYLQYQHAEEQEYLQWMREQEEIAQELYYDFEHYEPEDENDFYGDDYDDDYFDDYRDDYYDDPYDLYASDYDHYYDYDPPPRHQSLIERLHEENYYLRRELRILESMVTNLEMQLRALQRARDSVSGDSRVYTSHYPSF